MNPYIKYQLLDYSTISEIEMLKIIEEVFNIKRSDFDKEIHYEIVEKITLVALKLKYQKVQQELRKIYPLSFPEIEKDFNKTISNI